MNDDVLKDNEAKSIALTRARLANVLQEARKDEDRLKKILEIRRLKRQLRNSKAQ